MLRSAATTGQMLPARNPDQGWQPPTGQPRSAALAQRFKDLRDWHGRGYAGTPKDAAGRRWRPGGRPTPWSRPPLLRVLLIAAVVLLL